MATTSPSFFPVGLRLLQFFSLWLMPWDHPEEPGLSTTSWMSHPAGHLWTSIDTYWHQLSSTDIYGHLLISTGIYWHLLTSMGIYWPPLAFIDLHWQLLTFIGHLLTSTGIYWHLLMVFLLLPPTCTSYSVRKQSNANKRAKLPPGPWLLLGCPYLSDLSLESAVRPLPTAVKLLTIFDSSSTLIPSLSGHCISQRLPFYSPFC